jgi:hypothetical protein
MPVNVISIQAYNKQNLFIPCFLPQVFFIQIDGIAMSFPSNGTSLFLHYYDFFPKYDVQKTETASFLSGLESAVIFCLQ